MQGYLKPSTLGPRKRAKKLPLLGLPVFEDALPLGELGLEPDV